MSNVQHRIHFDRKRVRALMYARGITTVQIAEAIGQKETAFRKKCSLQVMMPDQLSRIAEALGCSVEYLTGEDDEIRRPDKQITCEHCGFCKKVTDAGGKRRICAKWHIYKVEPGDHCSWGEWRSLKELMNDD